MKIYYKLCKDCKYFRPMNSESKTISHRLGNACLLINTYVSIGTRNIFDSNDAFFSKDGDILRKQCPKRKQHIIAEKLGNI